MKGTTTFIVTKYKAIPRSKCGDICYSCIIYKVQSEKDDPNRTCITVADGDMFYPGKVATLTGFLELTKLVINSVLSRP